MPNPLAYQVDGAGPTMARSLTSNLPKGQKWKLQAGLDRCGVGRYTLDGARGWMKGSLCSPTLPQLLGAA